MAYTTADYARAYVSKYSLALVPLPPRTKRPLTKQWGHLVINDPDKAHSYFSSHPDDNIGVALGPSRLCSLDIDDEPAFRTILAELGQNIDDLKSGDYPIIQGHAPKFRLMFRVPDAADLTYHSLTWPKQDGKGRFTVVELRASCSGEQRQDVFPPSIHPDTGQPYQWLVKPNGHFPEPPAWLLTIWREWDKFKPQLADMCPWAPKKPPPKPRKPKFQSNAGQPSVIEAYNAATVLEKSLALYGYKRITKDRWLSPHSGTGLAGVNVFDDNRCFIHHASDPLCSTESGQPVAPFDLFRYYEHGGDITKAVRAAAKALGMRQESPQWPGTSWGVPDEDGVLPDPIDLGEPPDDVAPPIEAYDPPPSFPGTPEGYSTPFRREVEWTKPLDVFQAPILPILRREWLPEVIANFAFDQADIIGSDPAIVAASCLSACCGAIHDGIKLQPNRNSHSWLESCRLWIALVGDPSSKKSPAIARAMSRLKHLDIELAKQTEQTLSKYEMDRKIYDAAVSKYVKSPTVGEPIAPEKPKIDRLLVDDITVEKLGAILETTDRGVLKISDELSGWFGSMDAYSRGAGGKDRGNWLEAYNGGSRRIDRITRGSYVVPNWSVKMLGGIQPDVIQRIASVAADDGLLQRFILINGQEGKPGTNRRPDEAATARYRDTMDRLFALNPASNAITFSQEAEEIHGKIVEFAYEMIKLKVLPRGMMTHLGKWEGLSPRLMLTFHLIECASSNERPGDQISEATADRVYWFMRKFLFFHAYHFYTETLSESGMSDHVRRIAALLLVRGGSEIRHSDIAMNYRWYGRIAKPWEQELVINRLIDAGWVARKPTGMDAFKTVPTTLLINPSIHEAFANHADVEKRRREIAAEILNERLSYGEQK